MKKLLTYKGAVMTWECDSNDHMNVMYYINKFEHAGRNFTFEIGGTKDFLTSKNWGVVVVEQKINYIREVFEDDLLAIESSLTEISNKTYTVLHEMYNVSSGEMVATMRVVTVFLDKKLRKAVVIPEEIRQIIKKKQL